MSLNHRRIPVSPEFNEEARKLLNSFLSIGCPFNFFTRKVIKEITELIDQNLLVEEYDLEQLRDSAGKDLRDWCAKQEVKV